MERTTTAAPNFIPAGTGQPIFETLQTDLRRELDPQGVLEEEVFRILIQAAWNLRRVKVLLDALQQTPGVDPLADPAAAKQYDRFSQYETRYQRAFYKAMKELGALQTTRALRDHTAATQPEVAVPDSPVVEVAKLLRRAPRPIPNIDKAILEIEREAHALLLNHRIQNLETAPPHAAQNA